MKDSMNYLLAFVIVITIFLGVAAYRDGEQAKKYYAESAMIRAQSESRKDLAAALMPYALLGVVVVTGGGCPDCNGYIFGKRDGSPAQPQPPPDYNKTPDSCFYAAGWPEQKGSV